MFCWEISGPGVQMDATIHSNAAADQIHPFIATSTLTLTHGSGPYIRTMHLATPQKLSKDCDPTPKFPISQTNQGSLEAPPRIGSRSDLPRHGPLGMSCCVCYQGVDGISVGSCALRGRASSDQTCSGMSYGSSIGLGSGEFGGHVDALSSLSCSSGHPWTVLEVWQGELSWEGAYIAITECCCQEGMYIVCNSVWVSSPVHVMVIFG